MQFERSQKLFLSSNDERNRIEIAIFQKELLGLLQKVKNMLSQIGISAHMPMELLRGMDFV